MNELYKILSVEKENRITGIELITQERKEQIEKHRRTIENDVKDNKFSQLSEAACILCYDYKFPVSIEDSMYPIPIGWNEKIWIKMCSKPYKERLIIAGALIAAEIDRLEYN